MCRYFLFAILMFSFCLKADDLISINELKIKYLDNVTDPKKPVIRILEKISDNDIWSKPDNVTLMVTVENLTDKERKFMLVTEMHLLINKNETSKYYPILDSKNMDLKNCSEKPVWVWSRTFDSEGFKKLSAKEKRTVKIENISIKNLFGATEYNCDGFAIRVYAKTHNWKKEDSNYKNNVIQQIFIYSM